MGCVRTRVPAEWFKEPKHKSSDQEAEHANHQQRQLRGSWIPSHQFVAKEDPHLERVDLPTVGTSQPYGDRHSRRGPWYG